MTIDYPAVIGALLQVQQAQPGEDVGCPFLGSQSVIVIICNYIFSWMIYEVTRSSSTCNRYHHESRRNPIRPQFDHAFNLHIKRIYSNLLFIFTRFQKEGSDFINFCHLLFNQCRNLFKLVSAGDRCQFQKRCFDRGDVNPVLNHSLQGTVTVNCFS